MNAHTPEDSEITEAQAQEILRASNPIRDGWSNGDRYSEMQGSRKAELVFHAFGGKWYDLRKQDTAMKLKGY